MSGYTGFFTGVATDAFEKFALNAGMLLNAFDPEDPWKKPTDSEIICSTSGGITISSTPTYKDFAEDVDNVPNNILEYKQVTGWENTIGFTALDATKELLALALGPADVSGNAITPRSMIKTTDAKTVWWVGDKNDGGAVAVKLNNALGGGINMQASKDEKAKISVTLTGHARLADPYKATIEFFDIPPKST